MAGVILTLVDIRHQQRRPLVSLRAIGASASVQRRSTAVSFGVPAAAAALLVSIVGIVAGLDIPAGWGGEATAQTWLGLVGWAFAPALLLTFVATLIGYLLRPPRFQRSVIQDY